MTGPNKVATIEYYEPNNNHPISKLVASRDDDYYRTLYAEDPDFHMLGQRDPDFNAVLEHDSHLDFANPTSVMQLTKTLLKLDFGLKIDLPMDRLCPPVPNRHNYILWLKDLLDSSLPSYPDPNAGSQPVIGLDIGTGASLIYPLLGCVQRPSWSFIATDVDARSLWFARKNVALNNLDSRIRVVGRNIADPLVPLDDLGLETIDFVMVNPPFYTSEAELLGLARQKSRPPNTACTGAPIEMVCDGGEIGFVGRIIDESLALRERVRWYTCMLGKQSSLEVLIPILKDHGVSNYAVTAFVQGNKTRRWAIGWSFGAQRPSRGSSRGCEPSAGKQLLPHPTEATVATWSNLRVRSEQLERIICDAMQGLDLASWTWHRPLSTGVGFVDRNVWSRAYRREKARKREEAKLAGEAAEDGPLTSEKKELERKTEQNILRPAFGFSITLRSSGDPENNEDEISVVARWLRGDDYALFESFTGFLRKSIRPC
ncbi:hypothetical protein GGS26DRAFT_586898 [Hypomontagnella submonticulosa]|nr:hypothetical protein GGS26DRAFT_586898 [Hypomontagnella submonticulosa]